MNTFQALRHLFSRKDSDGNPRAKRSGGPGVELPWVPFGSLTIHSGKLFIGDGQMAPLEPGVIVDLEPGTYEVARQKMDFDGDFRVATMRVVLPEVQFSRGPSLGESWADTATQAVCDHERYKAAYDELGEAAYWEKFDDELCTDDGDIVNLDPENGAVLFITSSGWGDGSFPVFELLHEGKRVGVEIEMIRPGTSCPF
ncbi:MAG: hypothetical protein ABL949_16945 [Fimbriimonadaceae bacterium]